MINHKESALRAGVIPGMLAAAIFCTMGPTAWADPDMGGRHGMSMEGCGQMCMDEGMDRGMRGLHPHNAAVHFLKMASSLKLTDDQSRQLTKLRDEYIVKNATAEEQLKAAHSDLPRLLYADDIDMDAVSALFGKIGKMDSQLWRAYAQQLHDIKAMLTPEQKKALTGMWKEWHQDMEEMRDNMPMHSGGMPMHMDME